MFAGEMENLEYGDGCDQFCSSVREGGGGEKYFDDWRGGLELIRLLAAFNRKDGSGEEKSSSHSNPPPLEEKKKNTQQITET